MNRTNSKPIANVLMVLKRLMHTNAYRHDLLMTLRFLAGFVNFFYRLVPWDCVFRQQNKEIVHTRREPVLLKTVAVISWFFSSHCAQNQAPCNVNWIIDQINFSLRRSKLRAVRVLPEPQYRSEEELFVLPRRQPTLVRPRSAPNDTKRKVGLDFSPISLFITDRVGDLICIYRLLIHHLRLGLPEERMI